MKFIQLTFIILIVNIICLEPNQEKAKVYFTKDITDDAIIKMYKILNVKLQGNIAIKIHSGEDNGPYYLRPSFLRKIQDYTGGTFTECNAAYKGTRHNTEIHKKTIEHNGWKDEGIRFILMDEDEKDFNLTIAKHPTKNFLLNNIVGENIKLFDSNLVIAHFKGHGGGGYGGALKQMSIGYASRAGKTNIHTAGNTTDWTIMQENKASYLNFTHSMAEAAATVHNYFKNKNKGGNLYINIMVNISKLCDCAGSRAPAPKIKDIGILSSTDPVALDRACVDLIYKTREDGTQEWIEQLHRLEGENTIKIAEELGIGTTNYEIINVDSALFNKVGLPILLFLLSLL